jgi:hypothetical protein
VTKKHYTALAAAWKSQYDTAMRLKKDATDKGLFNAANLWDGQASGIIVAAETFCTVAVEQNPRFDRARFLAACGVQS